MSTFIFESHIRFKRSIFNTSNKVSQDELFSLGKKNNDRLKNVLICQSNYCFIQLLKVILNIIINYCIGFWHYYLFLNYYTVNWNNSFETDWWEFLSNIEGTPSKLFCMSWSSKKHSFWELHQEAFKKHLLTLFSNIPYGELPQILFIFGNFQW